MPLVDHSAEVIRDEVFIQISESEVGRAIRTRRWKYGVTAEGVDGYEHSDSDSYVETSLYDLQNDPYELNNLIGYDSHDNVAQLLKTKLKRQMVAAGEKEPTIESIGRKPYPCQMRVTEEEMNQ